MWSFPILSTLIILPCKKCLLIYWKSRPFICLLPFYAIILTICGIRGSLTEESISMWRLSCALNCFILLFQANFRTLGAYINRISNWRVTNEEFSLIRAKIIFNNFLNLYVPCNFLRTTWTILFVWKFVITCQTRVIPVRTTTHSHLNLANLVIFVNIFVEILFHVCLMFIEQFPSCFSLRSGTRISGWRNNAVFHKVEFFATTSRRWSRINLILSPIWVIYDLLSEINLFKSSKRFLSE